MKSITVGSLMVPLASYATVPHTATLAEALQVLERARSAFDPSRYPHRAVLVVDDDGKVIGKLSQMDVIRALDPDIGQKLGEDALARFGIDDDFIEEAMDRFGWLNRPLRDLCREAGRRNVAECMHRPPRGEFIQRDHHLREAVYRVLIGHCHSLLVAEGDDVVGILRLTDVFDALARVVKETHAA
jgi:CBS domain-containing protein